ncbi:MAG: four helix bundle protein [Patescibacteria group bacterium]|nr:MAG: four helix bundle protein [Patescibacteria group bacterium]
MSYINSYKELIVLQKAIELVKLIYMITENFPKPQLSDLTKQMRRCAMPIPSNTAEGYARKSSRKYPLAFGSARELETQLIIAKELQFLDETDFSPAIIYSLKYYVC